ncbi:UNVERIFIED_CONTAM: hypothetical protein FKN15_044022 [Acipenser sinensis]
MSYKKDVSSVVYHWPQTHGFISPVLPHAREQPIFTTRAHVFQIDPSTKKNWVPASKQAVTVSYFYDSTRNSYRIISVDGSKGFENVIDKDAVEGILLGMSHCVITTVFVNPFLHLVALTTNAKKWETELQTLRDSNARLIDSLEESATNVEQWKKQLAACKEESDHLRIKIAELEAQCEEAEIQKENNAKLSLRLEELKADIQEKDLELENLRKQAEIIPQLMEECESMTQKLQCFVLKVVYFTK